MPGKNPQPWYRKGRSWFVWIKGKPHALGQDREEAFRRFHLLMAGEVPTSQKVGAPARQPNPEAVPSATVQQLAGAYLDDAEGRLSGNPFRVAEWMVDSFAAL